MIINTKRCICTYCPFTAKAILDKCSVIFYFYWVLAVIMALLRSIFCHSNEQVCLPYLVQYDSVIGYVMMGMVSLIELILHVANVALFGFTAFSIRKSAKAAGRQWKVKDSKRLVSQISIIMISFLVWCSIQMYMFLDAVGITVPANILPWLTGMVLPLSALTNPIVYIIMTGNPGRSQQEKEV